MDIIEEAYIKAKKVVLDCSCSLGIKASALSEGYPQVWARDSMITLLGAILMDDPNVNAGLKAALSTLAKYQTKSGCIPSNVVVKDQEADFRAYIDGNCWFIIGNFAYFTKTNDLEFLKENWPHIKKALTFLESQDVYQTGLLAMQEAADWMDHIAVRGRSLNINALYYQALNTAAKIGTILDEQELSEELNSRSDDVKKSIKRLFWVDITDIELKEDFVNEEFNILSGHKLALLRERPYFVPYIGFRTVGTWFDTFGNLLTIIFGIATPMQSDRILDYISQIGSDLPFPVKAIYPPIFPGDIDWRDYYLNKNLNLPNHYHNGGIWPFVGGFYVVALIKAGRLKDAKLALEKLALANQQGIHNEWEFNEWLHGITGKPMGQEFQAWSAGMYIFAYECFKKNSLIFFNL